MSMLINNEFRKLALNLLELERIKHFNKHKPQLDNLYKRSELIRAAICYLYPSRYGKTRKPLRYYPWTLDSWKPRSENFNDVDGRIEEINVGLALGLAEVERLLRIKHGNILPVKPTFTQKIKNWILSIKR